MAKISVVINTHNEESNLERCLRSVKDFAEEIVVVDQNSSDKTVAIAKRFGAKIFKHPHTGIVEPARNFAICKASGDWIFIIDADEEAPPELLARLKKIAQEGNADYILIPRKNLIFGKWLSHSRWWPDYNIRFFKKGKVSWDEKIHSVPITSGEGEEIPADKNLALIHYNYTSVDQYLERNIRYAQFRASQLIKEGYHFSVEDLIRKPIGEFLSRYFEGEGYKDGLHGLMLAGLQSFSEFLVYLKIWEKEGFGHQEVSPSAPFFQQSINDFNFWQSKTSGLVQKIRLKIKSLI